MLQTIRFFCQRCSYSAKRLQIDHPFQVCRSKNFSIATENAANPAHPMHVALGPPVNKKLPQAHFQIQIHQDGNIGNVSSFLASYLSRKGQKTCMSYIQKEQKHLSTSDYDQKCRFTVNTEQLIHFITYIIFYDIGRKTRGTNSWNKAA